MTIFGDPGWVAIEVGECINNYGGDGPYVQFRFIINHKTIGDWDDRIPLLGSVDRAVDFCSSKSYRLNDAVRRVSSERFFDATYSAFYNYDYSSQPLLTTNLRDRYHLSEIGMSALSEKYGIAVAEFSDGLARVVVSDFQTEELIFDLLVESRLLDLACDAYIRWTREKFPVEREKVPGT